MKRRISIAAWCVIVLAAGLLWASLTTGHDWGDDFAGYLLQAKSLVTGDIVGNARVSELGLGRSSLQFAPAVYPWGFPLLLAVPIALAGYNFLVLKMVVATAYVLFLAVLWRANARTHPVLIRFLLVCLFACNPVLISLSNRILSDLPFLALSTLAVWMITDTVVRSLVLISRTWDSIILGVVIGAAILVRPNGVLLICALAAAQAVSCLGPREPEPAPENPEAETSRKRKRFEYALPYLVVCIVVAIARMALPQDVDGYLAYGRHLTATMVRDHLTYYLTLPKELLFGVPYPGLAFAMTVPLAAAGAWRRRFNDTPAIVYSMLTFVLVVCWPSVQGIRFILPVLPFYASFVLTGAESLARMKQMPIVASCWRWCYRLTVVLVVLIWCRASVLAASANMAIGRRTTVGIAADCSREMFAFIREHTEKDATVIFFKPRAMRLMTDRASIMVTHEDQLGRGDYVCTYLCHSARDQVELGAMERLAEEGRASVVFTNADFCVHRIRSR